MKPASVDVAEDAVEAVAADDEANCDDKPVVEVAAAVVPEPVELLADVDDPHPATMPIARSRAAAIIPTPGRPAELPAAFDRLV